MKIIKELRRSKKMANGKKISQEELAKIMEVSRSTVAMWEIDASVPDIETLKKLADFFNVSTDYLLGRDLEVNNLNNSANIPKEEYTDEEKEVVAFWRKMNNDQRSALKILIKSMNLK